MGLETESPWQTLISAALIGTERQPFTIPTAAGSLGQLWSQLGHLSNEAALLIMAATIVLHQRAGWLPETYPASSQTRCDPDDLPYCSPRAAHCLQQMLQGTYAQVLPEWLAMATQAGQRVPELHLPDLLNLGKQQSDLRAAILPVLGKRGRWLAMQNPDWSYAVEVASEEDWETGTQAARLLYLQDLRTSDPKRARELLQTTWNQEATSTRVKLLETLRTGLSLADESLLEIALNDRSKEVRQVAVELLASLPDSRLCQHITAHSTRYFTLIEAPPTLKVTLPPELDSSLVNLGIEPKPPKQATNLGEKAWWLLQMLGATPLTVWHEIWGMTASEILRSAKNHQWEAILLDGWALAAKRQQNAEWVEALLLTEITGEASLRIVAVPELGLEAFLDALSPEQQNAVLMNCLQSSRGAIGDTFTLRLMRHSRNPWSLELAQLVLEHLETHLCQQAQNLAWGLRTALREIAHFIPVSLIPQATKLRTSLPSESIWAQSVDGFLALLHFRQQIAQAFETSGG